MAIWKQFYVKRDKIADDANKKRAELETVLSIDTIKNEIEQQKATSMNQLDIWYKENIENSKKKKY